MPVDVLVVDDHGIVRDGIRSMLERSAEFRVCGEVATGAEAIRFCKQSAPALVVMDLSLPDLDGSDATEEIRRHCPNTQVIILSMYDDELHVMRALQAGAKGFIVKKSSLAELVDALRTVARGGSHLSAEISGMLVRRIQAGRLAPEPAGAALSSLSPRELQVLRLVAEGKSSKEIAVALDLELETIRSYRKNMMKKLGVNNAPSLTRFAVASGLVSAG